MTTHHILPIVALMLLASCKEGSKNTDEATAAGSSTETKAEKKAKLIEKSIFVGNRFNYIVNLSSINIIYTPGDYQIKAKGDSITLSHLDLQFDSNMLSVNLDHDNNTDYNMYGTTSNVTLYVSCPQLVCASTCSNGTFTCKGTWETDSVEVGVLGSGAFNIDTLICSNVTISANNTGDINIKHLKGNEATLLSRMSSNITADVDLKRLSILNDGTQTIKLSGMVDDFYVKNIKDKRLTYDFKNRNKE